MIGFYNASRLPQMQPIQPIDVQFNPREQIMSTLTIEYIRNNTEAEIANFIKRYIDVIVQDVLDDNCPYIFAFTSPKFVSSFIMLIKSIPIDQVKRMCCNKLAYDYLTFDEAKAEVKVRYMELCRTVNREAINRLMTIGISEKLACNLALSRYSSKNEQVNVKRLNFIICKQDVDDMSEQMIIYIYEKLFNKFSDLFQGTIFEAYTAEEENKLGEDFMEIFGRVTLAVLTILNNMTTNDIYRVLVGYATEWEYRGKYRPRCSLRTLSADYSRITYVVEMINSTTEHSIP